MRLKLDDGAEGRLRLALAAFFLALVVPGAWLLVQALAQTQWQVFHHYRALAAQRAEVLERELDAAIRREESRSFDDYAFDHADGQARARSPLAALPPPAALPGVIGYFQVDSAGRFSSPLLPPPDAGSQDPGPEDRERRRALVARLRGILDGSPRRTRHTAALREAPTAMAKTPQKVRSAALAGDGAAAGATAPAVPQANIFERLSRADSAGQGVPKSYGQVADLELDAARETRSQAQAPPAALPAPRARRREQVTRPELRAAHAAAGAASEAMVGADAGSAPAMGGESAAEFAGVAPLQAAPVRVFEVELEPMNLVALDDDHFVLYRNAWRDGARYIQGAVIARAALLDALALRAWQGSPLAGMSDFTVAWNGEVVLLRAAAEAHDLASAGKLRGELLYRTRLSAPLAAFELLYSVERLPLGAGSRYLAWGGLALLAVIVAGLFVIDRFGRGYVGLLRQQQDFVSAVSHELKTPLTAIRMYSEMLESGWGDESRRQAYYGYIRHESERLSRLIDNVLELARLGRGQRRVERRSMAMAALWPRLLARLAGQVEAAGFDYEVSLAPAALAATVEVDEDAVLQCLVNLVDNAIKFTPDDAPRHLVLSCLADGDAWLRLGVRDFGRGVPADQAARIFELFYRAESGLARTTAGTGIGLALVRELMLAQGGRVELVAHTPGAEFVLVLPAVTAPAGA